MTGKVPYWPYCPECEEPYDFARDEPFAWCACGITEWGDAGRPADYVQSPILLNNVIKELESRLEVRKELADGTP
jgi:hypothetical protein